MSSETPEQVLRADGIELSMEKFVGGATASASF